MTERSVSVRLKAITTDFQAGMASAGVSAKGLAANLEGISGKSEQSFKKLGMGMLDVGAGTVAVAAGAAIATAVVLKFGKAGVEQYVELASKVRDYQRVTGASAEEASRMVAVGDALGLSSDTLALSMFKLGRATESHADTLKADGIEIVKNAKGQTDLTATLANVADAYKKVGAGAAGDKLVSDAFGARGAKAMIPILQQGKAALEEFYAAAERHHQILSEDDVDKAFKYQVAVRELGEAWKGTEREVGQAVVPGLTTLAQDLTTVVEKADDAAHSAGGLISHLGPLGTVLKAGGFAASQILAPGLATLAWLHGQSGDAAHKQASAEQALANQEKASAEALKEYNQGLDDLYTKTFGVADSQSKFNKDLIDFADKVQAAKIGGDAFATSLDDATSTGIANQDMVRGLTKDIIATAKAASQNGESVSAATELQRNALVDVLNQLGFNKEAAQRYVEVLTQIPGDIDTKMHLDTSQAMAALRKYVEAMATVPNGIASPALLNARQTLDGQGVPGSIASPGLLDARQQTNDLMNWLQHQLPSGVTGAIAGNGPAASAALKAQQEAAKTAGDAAKKAAEDQAAFLEALWKQKGEVIRNEFAAGMVPIDVLNKRLDEEIAREVPWTDRWVQLQKEKTDALAQWGEALKGVQKMQQAFEDNEHESGVISTADYLAILHKRLDGLVQYSNDWMQVWRQINQIEQDAAAKAKQAQDESLRNLNQMIDQERQLRTQLKDLSAQHFKKLHDLDTQYNADQAKILDERRSQLEGWADVTQKTNVKWANSAGALALNIRDQTKQFQMWIDALADARRRGVSQAVIDVLGLDQGPQALGQLQQFASATTQQIDDLNAAVAQRQQLVGAEVTREATSSSSKVADQLKAIAVQHAAAIEQETEDFLKQQKALNDQLAQIGHDGGLAYGDAVAQGLMSSIPAIRAAALAMQQALQQATPAQPQAGGTPAGGGYGGPSLPDAGSYGGPGSTYTGSNGSTWTVGLDGHTWVPMPGFATGTAEVRATGPAIVHAGERIFSQTSNAALIAAVSSLGSAAPLVQVFVGGKPIRDEVKVVISDMNRRSAVVGSR